MHTSASQSEAYRMCASAIHSHTYWPHPLQVSDDISAKQAVAEETQGRIDLARKGYRTCGEYNAALFFCIADLAGECRVQLNWKVEGAVPHATNPMCREIPPSM